MSLDDIPKRRKLVVQRYLGEPYLINRKKFDLRIYVVVTSFDPLRMYMFNDGGCPTAPLRGLCCTAALLSVLHHCLSCLLHCCLCRCLLHCCLCRCLLHYCLYCLLPYCCLCCMLPHCCCRCFSHLMYVHGLVQAWHGLRHTITIRR